MKKTMEPVQVSPTPRQATEAIISQVIALVTATAQNEGEIQLLLSQLTTEALGQPVDAVGRTFLHLASQAGHLKTCTYLLQAMSPQAIEAVTELGRTALHLAARDGHLALCDLLLTHMSSEAIQALDFWGCTVLHFAAAAAGDHPALCELLLPKMNPEAIQATASKNGYTALHVAARNGHLAVCELLLSKMSPETINATSDDGWTVLHLAAHNGHLAVCELLLSKMSPETIDATSKDGVTVLHLAAQKGHQEVCRWLLAKMSQDVIEATDAEGKTALHRAADNGHQATCQELIDYMSVTGVVNCLKVSLQVKQMASQIVAQFVQETFLADQMLIVLDSHQLKLLQLYQVLDDRVGQVDRYVAEHYFELLGVCKVINREAPIAALTPIYHDYIAQVLEYLPHNLLWPAFASELSGNNDDEFESQ